MDVDDPVESESFLWQIFSSFGIHVVLILAAILFKWQYDRNRYRYPKGPRSLSDLKEAISFYRMKKDKLLSLSQEYPDCCTALTQTGRIVLLNNVETINELFVERQDLVSHKVDDYFAKQFRFREQKHVRTGIFYRHFDHNEKLLHKICVQHFDKNLIEKRLNFLIQREIENLRLENDFDVRRTMFKFSVRFLSELCSLRNGSPIENEDFHLFEESLYELSKFLHDESVKKSAAAIFSKLTGSSKSVEKNDSLLNFVEIWVKKHREENHSTKISSFQSNEDLLDAILNNLDQSAPTLEDDDIAACLLDVILHGGEMLKNSLSWILLYAVQFPTEIDDCRREAREQGYNHFDLEKSANLVRNAAFVKEVLRLSCVVPLVIHGTIDDFRWRDFHFQKRTWFAANVTALHLSSAWKNPNEFDVSRWIGENQKHLPKNHFAPFGFGPRSCVVENSLLQILTGILAVLLYNNDFEKNGPIPDLNEGTFGLSNAPNKFSLRAIPLSVPF